MGIRAPGRAARILIALGLVGALTTAACDTTTDPESPPQEDVATMLDEALADHVAGRLDDARKGYEDVLALDPQNGFALYNLGLIEQTENDLVAAEDFYRRALAIDPSFEAALFNLAIVHANSGDVDEAIELYKKTIEVNPASAGAHLNLGFLYLEMGMDKRGRAQIRMAIEIDPALADQVPARKGQPPTSPTPTS